jgi:hypothetical protein
MVLLGLAVVLGGCVKCWPVYQPPIDKAECIRRHNENAGQVESLWVHCDIDVTMHRPGKLNLPIGLDGLLVYRPPYELVLKGDFLGETQVYMGSNQTQYWMWTGERIWDTIYVGTWERFGARGTAELPIPATEVFWMLGIHPIIGATIRDAPVLGYTREQSTRHLLFCEPAGPSHVRLRRELIFDRTDFTKCSNCRKYEVITRDRVLRIRTYSRDGTLACIASCEGYKRFTDRDLSVVLPTHITLELLHPQRMTIKLRLHKAEILEGLRRPLKKRTFELRVPDVKWKVLLDEGGKRVRNE